MRARPIISTLLILFAATHSHAQAVSKESIQKQVINKWWTPSPNDPKLYLNVHPDDARSYPGYVGSLMFRNDNTYIEAINPNARGRRAPFSGKWTISKDTIIVQTTQRKVFKYKIEKIEVDRIRVRYFSGK